MKSVWIWAIVYVVIGAALALVRKKLGRSRREDIEYLFHVSFRDGGKVRHLSVDQRKRVQWTFVECADGASYDICTWFIGRGRARRFTAEVYRDRDHESSFVFNGTEKIPGTVIWTVHDKYGKQII